MSSEGDSQLLLIDQASFERRAKRAPRAKSPRSEDAVPFSLSLQFEAPKAPQDSESRLADVRRLALERTRASLRAKLEPAAALQRSAPGEPAEIEKAEPGIEDTGDVLVHVYVLRRKLSALTKDALLKTFADRLGGAAKKSDQFEAKVGDDMVTGRLDARSLVIRFSGPPARSRWLTTVQRVARENDLVELE